MSAATLVSVDEYLATTYHPDCDFVDGVLIERSVGTKDHSKLQREVLAWFRESRAKDIQRRLTGSCGPAMGAWE